MWNLPLHLPCSADCLVVVMEGEKGEKEDRQGGRTFDCSSVMLSERLYTLNLTPAEKSWNLKSWTETVPLNSQSYGKCTKRLETHAEDLRHYLNKMNSGSSLVLIHTHCFSYVDHAVLMLTSLHLHIKSSEVIVSKQGHPQLCFQSRARSLTTRL